MTVETLHSPHGARHVPPCHRMSIPESWVCPKCHEPFAALYTFLKHAKEAHNEPKGLHR